VSVNRGEWAAGRVGGDAGPVGMRGRWRVGGEPVVVVIIVIDGVVQARTFSPSGCRADGELSRCQTAAAADCNAGRT